MKDGCRHGTEKTDIQLQSWLAVAEVFSLITLEIKCRMNGRLSTASVKRWSGTPGFSIQ